MGLESRAGRRVVLGRHPRGALRPEDFSVERYDVADLADGELLVRNRFVSVDPMLRLFVDEVPLGGAMPKQPAGTTIPGPAVGEVVESRHPDYRVGDLVEGRFGWQDLAVSNGTGVNKVSAGLGAPERALGVGGLPGFTAYVGLEVAGGVKPGQTFLVSGAAGAVGSTVGAFVKSRGGRAVGIAAGPEKARFLMEEAGYDAVADRTSPDFEAQLAAALPKGADVYFDNVGGPLLAQVMLHMARGGLVLISGLMAQYQGSAGGRPDDLATVLLGVMGRSVRIQSFSQYGRDALRPAFEAEVAKLIASGEMPTNTHVEHGIERLPHAMCGLFDRSIAGKVVVALEGDK